MAILFKIYVRARIKSNIQKQLSEELFKNKYTYKTTHQQTKNKTYQNSSIFIVETRSFKTDCLVFRIMHVSSFDKHRKV